MTKAKSDPKSTSSGRNHASLERRNADAQAHAKSKAAFLTLWREGWSVRKCAEAAKVDRTTIWRWRQADQEFDRLFRAAREDGIDVFRDIAHEEARLRTGWAVALVLKMKGALPGDIHWEGDAEETAIGATFTIEDLAQRAIDRGYIVVPKSPVEIDGADIMKVT